MTDKTKLSDVMLEKVSGGAGEAVTDSKYKDGDMVRWSQHEDFGLGKVEYHENNNNYYSSRTYRKSIRINHSCYCWNRIVLSVRLYDKS